MKKILERIKKEVLHILPAFLFFLVMFRILGVTRDLALKTYGVVPRQTAIAIVGSLIVAKAILIADRIPLLNQYPRRPLIWNVISKTIVFGFIVFLFFLVEETVRSSRIYGGMAAGFAHISADVIWPAFWAREIWLTVLLLFYCIASELVVVLGADRVKEIFFGIRKS